MELIIKFKEKFYDLFSAQWIWAIFLALICIGLYANRIFLKNYLLYQIGKISYELEKQAYAYKKTLRPEKIIIVRHGQSVANIDDEVYASLPDNQIPLTNLGRSQAYQIGKQLKEDIGPDREVIFYVSPYVRAQETAKEILESFPDYNKLILEPRIREQEWGNLQKFQVTPEKGREIFEERNLVGRFYYRFETGESASDVYDRVSLFLETLFREMDSYSCASKAGNKRVIVVVTHGMVMRLISMRYFKQSVDEFDKMPNPKNCEAWVLNKDQKGIYQIVKKMQLEESTE